MENNTKTNKTENKSSGTLSKDYLAAQKWGGVITFTIKGGQKNERQVRDVGRGEETGTKTMRGGDV